MYNCLPAPIAACPSLPPAESSMRRSGQFSPAWKAHEPEPCRADRGDIGMLSVGFVSIADYGILPPALKSFRTGFRSSKYSCTS